MPGLAYQDARKILGPHLGALVVAGVYRWVTGAFPRFKQRTRPGDG